MKLKDSPPLFVCGLISHTVVHIVSPPPHRPKENMILYISWHVFLYPHYIVFSSFVQSKMILEEITMAGKKQKSERGRRREREREYPTFCLYNLVSHNVGAWGIMQVLVVLWKIGYLHSTYKAHRWMRLSCGAPEPWQCGEPGRLKAWSPSGGGQASFSRAVRALDW